MKRSFIPLKILFITFLSRFDISESINIDEPARLDSRRVTLPEEYFIYPGQNVAYKIYEHQVTWEEARDQCIWDGGHLAIIDSPDKFKHIQFINYHQDWLYIGIHKPVGDHEWIRVDNELPMIPEPIISPSAVEWSADIHACAIILSDSSSARLISTDCTQKEKSVCEILFTDDTKPEEDIKPIVEVKSAHEGPHTSSSIALPEGYSISYNYNVAYKIYEDQKTWEEARNQCARDGGHLAIAETPEKFEHIKGINHHKEWLYVGIHKPAGSYEWIRDDNELPITHAVSISPSAEEWSEDTHACAMALYDAKKLTSTSCSNREKSVCEIPYHDSTHSTHFTEPEKNYNFNSGDQTEQYKVLPDGYEEFPRFGVAYKIHEEYLTYDESRERCSADGGRLAIIDSLDKNKVISGMLRTGPVHVGIRMNTVYSNEWIRDYDGVLVPFLPWAPDHPKLSKCAALQYDGSGLEETSCSDRLEFVCEIPIYDQH